MTGHLVVAAANRPTDPRLKCPYLPMEPGASQQSRHLQDHLQQLVTPKEATPLRRLSRRLYTHNIISEMVEWKPAATYLTPTSTTRSDHLHPRLLRHRPWVTLRILSLNKHRPQWTLERAWTTTESKASLTGPTTHSTAPDVTRDMMAAKKHGMTHRLHLRPDLRHVNTTRHTLVAVMGSRNKIEVRFRSTSPTMWPNIEQRLLMRPKAGEQFVDPRQPLRRPATHYSPLGSPTSR